MLGLMLGIYLFILCDLYKNVKTQTFDFHSTVPSTHVLHIVDTQKLFVKWLKSEWES